MRRRELRSNRQESTLQNEPVRHQLRGSGRARSRERPGHPGGHAVESGPAAQDRTRLSRTAPAVQEHPLGSRIGEGIPRRGMHPHVQNRSFRDLTKGSIPYGPFVGTLLWETPRTPQRAGLMVVGLPNVARSPHDLESGVGTHVCRPFVPSTPDQGIMGCPGGSWGIMGNSGISAGSTADHGQ